MKKVQLENCQVALVNVTACRGFCASYSFASDYETMMRSGAVADLENFGGGGFQAQNLKNSDVFTEIESDFSTDSRYSNFFPPKIRWSPKKKTKKVFNKIGSDFSAGFVRFRLVGLDASLTGAELFEIEADFSAKIVTFRLVGGDASPPLNPPLVGWEAQLHIKGFVLFHR